MLAASLLACGLMVHPITLDAVVRVESHGSPIAIHVNGLVNQPHPVDFTNAATIAHRYMTEGRSVDLGLMQVNSRNLEVLNLTVEQVLDPCTNLHAGATILASFYATAVRRYGQGQQALAVALSAYNTGTWRRGFQNGYVAKYYVVPPIQAPRPAAMVLSATTNKHASDTEVW